MELRLFERDGKTLVQGIVTEKRPGTGAGAGRVVNIKIKGQKYENKENVDETMDIGFWNSDSKQMCDSANNRLHVGDYVSVLVGESNGKYAAIAFKKNGIWNFAADVDNEGNERSEVNYIIGLVVNGELSEDKKRYSVSIPVTTYDSNGTPDTEWVKATFFANNDEDHLPENACKVLQPYQPEQEGAKPIRKRAAIKCGKLKLYGEANDRKGYTAYRFSRID